MARKLKPDRILFLVTLGLVGSGVAMVFSSSAIVAKEKFGDPNYFSFKQLIFATLGLAVMFVVMKVDYHTYRRPAVVFSGLAAVVALLVLVFFLATSANTHRCIHHLRAAGFLSPGFSREVPARAHSRFFESLGRASGAWVSGHPVAVVGRVGRYCRARIHGRKAKAVLFTRSSHGFHFCGRWRRDGHDRHLRRARIIHAISVARPAHVDARPRPVRVLPGPRHHDDGVRSGLHQHERGAGPLADQRNSSAVPELRG